MDINVLQGYNIVFASMINEVEISTTSDGLYHIEISCNNDLELKTTLTAINKNINLCELGEIAEEYCERHGISIVNMKIKISSETDQIKNISLTVLYCNNTNPRYYGLSLSEITNKFLSNSKQRIISGDFPDYVYFYKSPLEELQAEADVLTINGTDRVTENLTLEDIELPDNIGEIKVDLKDIQDSFNNKIGLVQLIKEARTMMFLPFNQKPLISFYYRNNYNAWQLIEIYGQFKVKQSVSQSLAIRNKNTSIYDKSVALSIEVQPQIRFIDDVEILMELTASNDVRLADNLFHPSNCQKIILTDQDMSTQIPGIYDSSLKFSFQFKDGIPPQRIRKQHRIFNYKFVNYFT